MTTHFTPEDMYSMAQLRLKGVSYRQIADKFELSPSFVHYLLTGKSKRARSILGDTLIRKLKAVRRSDRKLSNAQARQALALWYDGHTLQQIANRFEVSCSVIHLLVSGFTYKEIHR